MKSWKEYKESLNQHFLGKEVTDVGKKRAILITVIGSKTYTLLKNSIHSDLRGTKSYDELAEALKKHLCPEPIVIAERYKFYEAKQRYLRLPTIYICRLSTFADYLRLSTIYFCRVFTLAKDLRIPD